MAFLTTSERAFLRAIANLGYCNPFLPERIEIHQHYPAVKVSDFGRKIHRACYLSRVIAKRQSLRIRNSGKNLARRQFKIKKLREIAEY